MLTRMALSGACIPEDVTDLCAHIAALKADIAALVPVVEDIAGKRGTRTTCLICRYATGHHKDTCPAGRAVNAPHPGAHLLAEHAEQLAAAARRHETTRATMQVREEQHAEALVRARNEGLEKAALAMDGKKEAALEFGHIEQVRAFGAAALYIRTLKESES